jgi:ATP synthase protein I
MAEPRDSRPANETTGRPSVTDDLAERIARARAERQPEQAAPAQGPAGLTGISRGFRLASEFVAAIVVGAGLGYGIDAIFSTRPWAMVILLLLGFAAGVLNVVRATAQMNAATAVPPDTPAVRDDEDE